MGDAIALVLKPSLRQSPVEVIKANSHHRRSTHGFPCGPYSPFGSFDASFAHIPPASRFSVPPKELLNAVDLAHKLPVVRLAWFHSLERADLLSLAHIPCSVCHRSRQSGSSNRVSAEDHDEWFLVDPLTSRFLVFGGCGVVFVCCSCLVARVGEGALLLNAKPEALVVGRGAGLVKGPVIVSEVGGDEGFRIPAVVLDGMLESGRRRRRMGEWSRLSRK
jgi:hypothetical protein